MSFENNIKSFLKNKGVDFIHFVDISELGEQQNKGFQKAIVFGIVLSAEYLKKVSDTPFYVEKMKQNGQIKADEFHLTELKTDRMADELAAFLKANGFEAYSQSEANIEATGFYDLQNYVTPLPHKTLAGMAGLGWIGKHNLLITPEYGSAVSMCSVLSNAPMETVAKSPQKSQCGTCNICVEICRTKALTGNNWEPGKSRENLVNVHKCTTCFECVVRCPWTQKYMKDSYSRLP